jgi:arylsulfatase A-like enzyme
MDEFAMVDPAISWVKKHPEQPFLLTFLTVTTHHPYQTPSMKDWPQPGEEFQGYLEAIEHLDNFASTVYQKLEEAQLTDNTLFIIVGDHGEAFGEHYRMQHDVVPYEEGIHVPLYMYNPQLLGKARQVKGLRHHIDILPTILEVLGMEWKGQLPGKSLLTTDGHPFVMSSCWYTNFCLALRTERWKFIYHYGRMMPEIFDLSADPNETRNLVSTVSSTTQDETWEKLLSLKVSIDHFYDQYSDNENPVVVQIDHP